MMRATHEQLVPFRIQPFLATLATYEELKDYMKDYIEILVRQLVVQELYVRGQDQERRIRELEGRWDVACRELVERMKSPRIQYVGITDVETTAQRQPDTEPKIPMFMNIFHAVGAVCTISFGILVILSGFGIRVIHPFISLIGMVGGLGWVVTAWVDLWLTERKISGGRKEEKTEKTVPAAA